MKTLIKTLAVLTAGVGAVAVVKRVRKEQAVSTNGFLVIDIKNSNLTDVINEYSKLKNKN